MQYWRLIKEVATLQTPPDPNVDPTWGKQIPDDFLAADHPKLTFNFTMEIAYYTSTPVGNADPELMNLALKTATRPQPTITYQDVNFYNYRTKVATKTDYGTTTVTFYDDGSNKALNIYRYYLNSISPISNSSEIMNDAGVPFGSTSSIGPLSVGMGLIKNIKIFHYYRGVINAGSRVSDNRIVYSYLNPKITNFIMDDLSMMQSEASTVAMTFAYDAVNITQETLDGQLQDGTESTDFPTPLGFDF